jgi:hypothetical protein
MYSESNFKPPAVPLSIKLDADGPQNNFGYIDAEGNPCLYWTLNSSLLAGGLFTGRPVFVNYLRHCRY